MTIDQAKQDLTELRSHQRELRRKIDALRRFLAEKGINPDPPAVDLTQRNNAMYSRHLDGLTWEEIAKEFKLSKERVMQICKREALKKEREAKQRQQEAWDSE